MKQRLILNQTKAIIISEWSEFYQIPNYPSNVTQPSLSNTSFFNNIQYRNYSTCPLSFISTDAYIVNCYFYSITYRGNGAAIYIDKENVHFLVECATTGDYGGGRHGKPSNFE